MYQSIAANEQAQHHGSGDPGALAKQIFGVGRSVGWSVGAQTSESGVRRGACIGMQLDVLVHAVRSDSCGYSFEASS